MESWFSTVKSEEGERFDRYADAKEAVFDYIEGVLEPASSSLDARPDQPSGVRMAIDSRRIVKPSTESNHAHIGRRKFGHSV